MKKPTKNPIAQALRALAKPKNMARPSEMCRQAALKGWETRPRKNPRP